MIFEEFDPRITPGQNLFNDLQEYDAWQNTVMASNSQCHISIVRLSTILQILIEDTERNKTQAQNINQKLTIASSRVCRKIKTNYSSIDLKELLYEANNNTHLLFQLEHEVKERRQMKNLLSKLINNCNLNVNNALYSKLQEIDEELLWLMQEYYRLSSLPNLTDSDAKRMLLILELAQFDPQLDDFINQIDAAIAEEAGITETNASEENSITKRFKEIFIKYLEQRLSDE